MILATSLTRPLSPETEVVLQPTDKLWLYYMVDVKRRCIFWLDICEFDDSILPPNFGIEREEQLRECIICSCLPYNANTGPISGHLINYEFWLHIGFFPSHRHVMPELLDEVMGILAHGHVGILLPIQHEL